MKEFVKNGKRHVGTYFCPHCTDNGYEVSDDRPGRRCPNCNTALVWWEEEEALYMQQLFDDKYWKELNEKAMADCDGSWDY